MKDATVLHGAVDRLRVNVDVKDELENWSRALRVTPDELRELVRKHGVQIADIRKALGISS